MSKLTRKFKDMTPEQLNNLLTIFLATALGSLGTTAFMTWVSEGVHQMGWVERMAVTLIATVIYGAIIVLTFYVFSPQSRPALKRIFTRQD
jgi:Na+-transporting NADH:ubiquinone oxidoreductase subunit NqrB